MMVVPWLLHDAEVALWPAWQDGMPFHGPGAGRDLPAPLLHCKSSLTMTESFDASGATGHGWTGAEMSRGSNWTIAIDFPDGAVADTWGRLLSGMHAGGYRILTVRFLNEATSVWTLLTFFYVTPATDAGSQSGEVMSRAVTLKSSWRQETVGTSAVPGLEPVVIGEVDWICGTQRITALNYNPVTETWTSLPRNLTGDGTSRYVTLSPIDEDDGSDVVLGYYLPRLEAAPIVGTLLPAARVKWQNTIAMQIGNQDSAQHHGLTLLGGHALQTAGIVEPLVKLSQDRVLDEPVVVFRFLRRIYATLGHGVLAVPALEENEDPPVTHDPAFRIAVPGPANPSTGQSGLVLLPNGAWLDGTAQTLS